MKLETLLSKADKSQSAIKSKVVRVNSKFALECLKNMNNSNRPMSKGVAKLYANEMLRGQWKCNGEPLIFSIDEEGNEHLISGQHRLQGLIFAQQEIEKGFDWPVAQTEWDAVIISGVPHDTADTVDTGKARSHSDVLFRDPYVDSIIPDAWNETVAKRKAWTKTLAGAARLVWLIDGGAVVSSAPKFLISEMLSFIQNTHTELHKFVTMVLDANDSDGGNKGLKMSLPYLAALSYVASIDTEYADITIDETVSDKIDAFLNALAVGTGYEKGDPAWALAGYWNKLTAEPGSKDRDRDWVGPYVKAVKALLEDRTGLKVSDVSLTAKERKEYNEFPIMFDGYHTAQFERAAAAKAEATAQKESKSETDDGVHGEEAGAELAHDESGEDSFEAPQAEAITKRPRPKRKPKTASTLPS